MALGRSAVCVVILVVAAASILQNASATSRFSSSLDSEKESTSLRFDLKLREPAREKMSTTDRIAHHVKASLYRAKVLYSRIQGSSAAGSDWDSNVTAISGGYAMSLSLGTPPQTFSVIADTGSDLTWLQAKGCGKCFTQPDAPYDLTKSSSYKPLSCSTATCSNLGQQSTCKDSTGNCEYTYEYGDQSTTNGAFSTETITVTTTTGATQRIPEFAFGVGLQNSVGFAGVDGLLGLGQGPISFPSQLGADYGNVFSYCLVNWSDSPSQTSPIIFGSAAIPSGDVKYTPLQTGENTIIPTFWFLSLTGVSVDGQKLDIEEPKGSAEALDLGTVIDSGTTVSLLDTSTYQALTNSLEKLIKYPKISGGNSGLDFCFDTSKDLKPTFPGTTFHFEGSDWVLPQENTFLPVDDKGTWCLAMLASDQGIQIFGNIQQQNFQVVYDKPNSQLGWVQKQCDAL